MSNIISISNAVKSYDSGLQAVKGVSLDIKAGEIFALLGPNGAGKTTLISMICGVINLSGGKILVDGHDIIRNYRQARALIGLVPQELSLSMFESVWATVKFTRGLYGKPKDDAYLEQVLRDLSLWDKKDSKIITLSGGMKRRVLIAKALAHQPKVLFLDEPTAGVDVELRQSMWAMIHKLREQGCTVILTTHYIDEAEEMADRIGVISQGELVVVEDKSTLMEKLGNKQLLIELAEPIQNIPESLAEFNLELNSDNNTLTYSYAYTAKSKEHDSSVPQLMAALIGSGIQYTDLNTSESSLEEIFVNLLEETS